MKKFFSTVAFLLIISLIFGSVLTSCQSTPKEAVYVYNYGEYIDPDLISQFERETGIKVYYDMYESPEDLYTQLKVSSVQYDCACTSDYMVEKMISEDMLSPIDWSKISTKDNIGATYYKYAETYDKGNKYSIPYFFGTLGLLCNKDMLKEKGLEVPESWADLWKEEYKGEIIMINSMRDAFAVAFEKNGFSLNTKDEAEIKKAAEDLIAQKPLVNSYVQDQTKDKLMAGEASIGVIYSGDAAFAKTEMAGEVDFTYVTPKEGTNLWIDAWFIPKNARNIENAHKWLDFLGRADVAAKNFDFIQYSIVNNASKDLINKELIADKEVFIDLDDETTTKGVKFDVYVSLGADVDRIYDEYWKKVLSN